MQVELIRFPKNISTFFTFTFPKRGFFRQKQCLHSAIDGSVWSTDRAARLMDLRNRLWCVTIHSVSDSLCRIATASERIRLVYKQVEPWFYYLAAPYIWNSFAGYVKSANTVYSQFGVTPRSNLQPFQPRFQMKVIVSHGWWVACYIVPSDQVPRHPRSGRSLPMLGAICIVMPHSHSADANNPSCSIVYCIVSCHAHRSRRRYTRCGALIDRQCLVCSRSVERMSILRTTYWEAISHRSVQTVVDSIHPATRRRLPFCIGSNQGESALPGHIGEQHSAVAKQVSLLHMCIRQNILSMCSQLLNIVRWLSSIRGVCISSNDQLFSDWWEHIMHGPTVFTMTPYHINNWITVLHQLCINQYATMRIYRHAIWTVHIRHFHPPSTIYNS